jgi:hypothetical protein
VTVSLLDWGTHTVTVFPAVDAVDGDGNPATVAGSESFCHTATIQPLSSTETAEMGVVTGEVYRLRFAHPAPVLRPRSQVEWDGELWSVRGWPAKHTGSPRTGHLTYHIARA